MKSLWTVTFSIALLFSFESYSQEIQPFFRSVRAQAMGGAGVATVNDETALFINPAGLGKIRGPYFVLINPELETNYEANAALSAGFQYAAVLNAQSMLDVAKRNPDKRLHLRVQAQPSFVTTNFGFGVYSKYNYDGEYTSSTDNYHLDYINDYGAVIGYNLRLWEGRIKIGFAGKFINRVYVNQDVAGTTTGLQFSDIANEGGGVGWDGGVILSGPWLWLPSIAAVVHDVGKTYFTTTNGYFYRNNLPRPPPQSQSIDAAIAVFPILSNKVRSSFTAEWRDVQNPERVDIYRRLHVGAEINFNDTFFLRGGMNQRYYTAGFELSMLGQQFQFTTYGEEIGTPTRFREDRRYIIEYGIRF
ncbi:MAG: hypothetical protein SGI74_10880 [Oligoflexia bacterium]|nr:hypothetical protein [Oligoflexia bacterium]